MKAMSRTLLIYYKMVFRYGTSNEIDTDKFPDKKYKWFFDWQNRILFLEDLKTNDKIMIPFESILRCYIIEQKPAEEQEKKEEQVKVKHVDMTPATPKQKEYLKQLGVPEEEINKMTKKQASEKIKELTSK